MTRQDVEFTSGGLRCAAWWYEPEQAGGPVPVVVIGHGLGGTRHMGLDDYARRFVTAGYACLVFDYRHFGGSEGRPRQLLSVRRQLADWEAAVAFARARPGADPDRVVAWGTSFGGGHVLRVAAHDPRPAAAIAQCPFTDGVASALAISPVTNLRVGFRGLLDRLRTLVGASPVHLPAAAAPGTPAFMTAPDALPGIEALGSRAPDFENRLTARSSLAVLAYAPGRSARRIGCPVHVALCEPDTVAPTRASRRHLSRAARAEVVTHRVGHFDIYAGEAFERAVEGYLDFLRRHVPLG